MNIWNIVNRESGEEIEDILLKNDQVRLTRIVSTGQVSPKNFWYDQDENEIVILLQGEAILMFLEKNVKMKAGDYLLILAHQKHRVSYTSIDPACIWLCLFY